MSTDECKDFLSIGRRLREERERLGYNQVTFGDLIPTSRQTIASYESGQVSVRASDLVKLKQHGVDIFYVLTGEHEKVRNLDISVPVERLMSRLLGLELDTADVELLVAIAEHIANKKTADFVLSNSELAKKVYMQELHAAAAEMPGALPSLDSLPRSRDLPSKSIRLHQETPEYKVSRKK